MHQDSTSTNFLHGAGGSDKLSLPPAVDARTLALGENLQLVRTKVYRESLAEFSERLNICINTLRKMENGHPGVAIGTWFQAFTLMQVEKSIIDASRPDGLLLLSQFPRAVNEQTSIAFADD